MKYKNMRTGAVIETTGRIHGGDWREIPAVAEKTAPPVENEKAAEQKKTAPTKKPAQKTAAKTKAVKKNG